MSILVATDLSPCSRSAVQLAAALALRSKESLVLLHAIEPISIDLLGVPLVGWEQEMLAAGNRALASEAGSARASGITVETEVRLGSASVVILDVARKLRPSLIVLGTHGRRGVARLFVGSCAEEVTWASPCPVLVTGAHAAVDLERWNSAVPLHLTVAADGSRASDAALYWVRTARETVQSDVSLLRIYWPPQAANHYGLDEPWQGTEGHPDLVRLLERDLRREAQALSGTREPRIRFRVASHDTGAWLADDVRQLGADAIVIGVPARGRGNSTGVTPAAVLRSATVPVFCIPEGLRPRNRRQFPRFHAALVACDLSPASQASLPAAYALLSGGGRVELTYVHERATDAIIDPRQPEPLTEHERTVLESRLRAAVPPEASEHGISTHTSVVEHQSAAEAILQAAERLDVDVIALGSHGRSGLARAVLGSVAEDVARRSTRPVLIVRENPRTAGA